MNTCRIRRLGHYEGLCFCISSCGQEKRVLCSKCDDPNFLQFGQHLPLGSVNVCCTFKNELWEQLEYDDPVKTASMSTRRIRRVGLTKGCAFASAAVPRKKGYFARNVTIKVSSNLHIICLWVPSKCGENIRTNCGSSSDEMRINEYTSNKKARSLRRVALLHQQLCPEKKGNLLEM